MWKVMWSAFCVMGLFLLFSATALADSGTSPTTGATVAQLTPPPEAEIVVMEFTVIPERATLGQPVTASATFKNTGGAAGEYTADLKIDGARSGNTRRATLQPGKEGTEIWVVQDMNVGSHTAQVEDMQAHFSVEPCKLDEEVKIESHVRNPEVTEGEPTIIEAVIINNFGNDCDIEGALSFTVPDGTFVDGVSGVLEVTAGVARSSFRDLAPDRGEAILLGFRASTAATLTVEMEVAYRAAGSDEDFRHYAQPVSIRVQPSKSGNIDLCKYAPDKCQPPADTQSKAPQKITSPPEPVKPPAPVVEEDKPPELPIFPIWVWIALIFLAVVVLLFLIIVLGRVLL